MSRSPDIIVVGAGVIGCAVAYELSSRGASVQLIDQRSIGMGATQASAGILAPYVEAEKPGPLLDLTLRSLGLFDDFVARVSADSRLEIPYRRIGTLQVAATGERMKALEQQAAWLQAQGVSARVLEATSLRAEEPALGADLVGGLVVATHGFVSAGELTHALAVASRRHGAQIVEASEVCRVAPSNADLVVETDRGVFRASIVVLAAGSWASRVEIAGVPIPVPVRPVRGQLVRLAWTGPPLARVTWTDRCYLVPWEDGTLLVGATVEEAGFDERTTAAGVHDLIDAACDVLPRARSAGFVGARAGLRPATPDELPLIGRSHTLPNLMYATGHYRNGVLLAPLTAVLVADALLDNRTDPLLGSVSPERFGGL